MTMSIALPHQVRVARGADDCNVLQILERLRVDVLGLGRIPQNIEHERGVLRDG